ncbi:secretion/conjugation apparatus DotM-related subunit [Neptuniibacter halophilus]|uniref:secretion/conjugation apparatus DotM-related subunit n=1 Tax=Neptuniibacter halophilus TaxID=651666 RepID=UPI002574547D|nr:hypothetical protein [Neptuniibacter halophilus]
MANPENHRQGDGAVATFLVLFAMISAMLAAAWFLFSPYIAWGTVQFTLFVKPLLHPFTVIMNDGMADFILNMRSYLEQNMNFSTVTVGEVMFLQGIAFRAISVILVPLLIWRGVSNIIFSKKMTFKRKIGLHELAEIQASRYPRMKPAIKAKLLDQDQRFGPWATQRNPLQLLIHHGLVTATHDPDRELVELKQFNDLTEHEQLNELNSFHGKLDIDKKGVEKMLVKQLGPRCQYNEQQLIDIHQLPKIERTMAIIFLATRTQSRDIRKKINALLDQFGDSFVEGKAATSDSPAIPHQIDLSGVDELWEEVKNHSQVKLALVHISRTHAYWSTAFTAMFQFVYTHFRNLKSRDFIFLKPVNRQLYLLCNQVGLEQARPEVSGIRCHYLAEIKLGAPIVQPTIEDQAYQLILSVQNEGWLHEDIVPNDYQLQLDEYNTQYAKDLAEFSNNPIDIQTTETKTEGVTP